MLFLEHLSWGATGSTFEAKPETWHVASTLILIKQFHALLSSQSVLVIGRKIISFLINFC